MIVPFSLIQSFGTIQTFKPSIFILFLCASEAMQRPRMAGGHTAEVSGSPRSLAILACCRFPFLIPTSSFLCTQVAPQQE